MAKEKITYQTEGEGDKKDQIKKLKNKLKSCQKEKEEYLTLAQRARADLINYRRRQEEAVEEMRKYSQVNLIREILSVLDSLAIAGKENKDVLKIKEQLEKVLADTGVKEIKSRGEKFNPEIHEAVEQVKSEEKEGMIAEEIQKGYFLNGKVIRPSRVRVAK